MRIKIITLKNHLTYGGMRTRLEYGFQKLGETIVEEDPDVILVVGQSASWDEVKGYNKPVYLWCHGVDIANFDSANNKKLLTVYNQCEGVAYQSTFARNMTWKAFDKKEGPIIFNASVPSFPPSYALYHSESPIYLATTAIWRPWKRLEETERLVKEGIDRGKKITLYVAGKDGDSGHPNIKYMGVLSDFSHYYSCHLYLQLSFCDYSPGTVGEALAMGLPVLTVNSGGSKELVDSAGVGLDNDPIPDGPINVNDERNIPPIKTENFWRGFDQMIKALDYYRAKTRERVELVANATYTAKQWIDIFYGKSK